MLAIKYFYYFIVIFNLIHINSCARPTFHPLFQVSDGTSTDSRTGLPLHTNTVEQKLTITKNDLQRQSKSTASSSSSYMVIDQLKSLELNTTTKLNGTACIALNVIQSLQSVVCLQDKIKMIFDTAANSAYTYKQWRNRQVKYINGGKEWNCTDSTTGEPILIMKKLIPSTFTLNKNEITVAVTSDIGITPLVCFEWIALQMQAVQELSSENNSSKNTTNSTGTNIMSETTTTSPSLTTTRTMKSEKSALNEKLFGFCSSNTIYINTQPHSNQLYQPGQQIYVSWSLDSGFDHSKVFEIILKRTRITGIAENMETWNVPVSQNYAYLTIPSNLEVSTTETYFIDFFWWDCAVPHWQSTNVFRIPTAPTITAHLPATQDQFSKGDTVRITWTPRNFDAAVSSKFIIKLKRYRLLMWDEEIYSLSSCKSVSSGLCDDTLSAEASLSDFYYEFNWCGSWGLYSCSSKGNYFQIPIRRTGKWNYNIQEKRAASRFPLFHTDCGTSKNAVVTRLCNDGISMSIDLMCTNCYMIYDYSTIRLDLFASHGVLGNMNIQLHAVATVNLEVLLTVNFAYQKADTKKLAGIPLLGFSFSVLGVSFSYGCLIDLDLPYEVKLDGLGQLSAGLQYQVDTSLELHVTDGRSTHSKSMSLKKINYPVKGDIKAHLVVDIALRPSLKLSAVIFEVAITTEGFLRLENMFQYPPFSVIDSNTYNYNSHQPSIYHWSFPSDACGTPHLLQYHVQFGIRKTLLIFNVNLGSHITSYISHYVQTHYEVPLITDSNVYELVSGCLFKVPHDDNIQPADLYLDIPYNSSFSLDDYFKTSIMFDLAKVVQTDPSRILYNSVQSHYDQMRKRAITMVKVSLLPSAAAYSSDPSVRSLAKTLLDNELDTSSVLYTNTKFLKFLFKDLTQKSNVKNGLIETTTASNTVDSISPLPTKSQTPTDAT